ncbi:2'-5' RNA ligase [Halalkaliarchaeum desulfuricum]|uniref:RNA 2',3'-cyclic phosphodiesterase n=1 Tax=Halalkaliarchaeum desulfuricum TaxID=2055893 RepID=A0A343TJU1_9EURY|nr:RNA 2',3'-cyclic phosphodiesterase [Halalkaliarchaeum desulfuricum]AUX09363.1 2'-5' RNA ligase [Halalkaliarchaeum desulfuricum]
MRLFFAVDLPDRLADDVAAVQDRLRDAEGLRFTDPAQAHLTLKFLGDVDTDRVEELETAAREAISNAEVEHEDGTVAPVEPFEAEVGGLGVFPSVEYISVVWAGFRTGEAELTALHEALEAETTALGFDPEDHEFTPHVTLARMDDARGKEIVQEAVTETDPTIGRFRVEDVRLKESILTPEGPEYDTVARFELS